MTGPAVVARRRETRQLLRAERDEAVELLERAQAALARVEPSALRRPLWMHFAATIELCRAHHSLSGLPVNYVLEMARAILGEQAV